MAIALVQGPKRTGSSGASSITVGSAQGWATPTAGNILVCLAVSSVNPAPTLTVTGFTQIAATYDAAVDVRAQIWVKTAAGTETDVTLTCSTGTDNLYMECYEFSGLSTTVDGATAVNADSATISSLSTGVLTATSNVLLFAGWGLKASGNPFTNFTNSFVGSTGGARQGSAYRIVSSAADYECTATWTTAKPAVSVMIGLRATGGGVGMTGSATAASSARGTLTGGGGITLTAATDAELVAALQAAHSGETIKLTVTRDYTVLVSDVDCRPNGVTVVNDTGINARIRTGTASNEGFQDCFGINFTAVRFASTKFWGGGNIEIVNSPLAANLYFQGNHTNSSITGSTFTTSGFGITLDGRRGTVRSYVENFTISGCTFTQMGVDPIRVFGLRDSLIEDNLFQDVSSYRYSGDQTSNRLHSDGMDCTQMDRVTIRNNTFDLIEWQGIILKNHGYFLGWPEHLMRDIVIDGNTFSRIGHANFPEIGATGGGCGIFVQDCTSITVKNNTGANSITRAALNWFHLWDGQAYLDPTYGTYDAGTNTVTYLKPVQVFFGNNTTFSTLNTPPGGGWAPSKKNGEPLLPLSEGNLSIAGKANIASSAGATLTPSNLPLTGSAPVASQGIASITPPGEGILILGSGATASGAVAFLQGGDFLILAIAESALSAGAVLTVTNEQLYFSPPTLPTVVFYTPSSSPAAKRLFSHYAPSPRGQAVLKISGTYQTFTSPTSAQVISAEEVYLGGHRYPVSEATANALIAAGYTVSAS